MAEGTRVASIDQVGEEEVLAVEVGERQVALTRVGQEVFAFENDCSHMHCTFDDAEVEGTRLQCVCHGSAFDLRTGDPTGPPATEPIPVYPVRIEDGAIFVDVG